MAIPLVSADRYDHKEAFKHKHCGSNAFQKFSGALQLNTSSSPTSSFWGSREPFGWKCVENAQKWAAACVSWNKKCFWCVCDTPWMFLDSLDHSKHASNLFCAYTTRNGENFVNFSETSFPKSAQIPWFYSKIDAESHLGSMNSQKSLSAHVCRNKNGLGRRTATPFVSADRYDPKEASE